MVASSLDGRLKFLVNSHATIGSGFKVAKATSNWLSVSTSFFPFLTGNMRDEAIMLSNL